MKTPNLGPLAKVVSKPKFEAGVLVGVTIVKDANHTAGHALWSTVRTIDAGQFCGAEYHKVYCHRVMRALRNLTFENGEDLVKFCTGATKRPIERLVVDWLTTPAQARALANATALPKLRELELRLHIGGDDHEVIRREMTETVAAIPLDRLWLDISGATDLATLHATCAAKRLELEDRMHLRVNYVFERGSDGKLSRLAVVADLPEKSRQHQGMSTGPGWIEAMFERLETTLGSLPKRALTEVSIVSKTPLKKPANTRRLAALLKRLS